MTRSVSALQDSQISSLTLFSQSTGKRSEELERVCQESIEAFESRLLELGAAKVRIRHTVDLNHRQRDNVSMAIFFSIYMNRFQDSR